MDTPTVGQVFVCYSLWMMDLFSILDDIRLAQAHESVTALQAAQARLVRYIAANPQRINLIKETIEFVANKRQNESISSENTAVFSAYLPRHRNKI